MRYGKYLNQSNKLLLIMLAGLIVGMIVMPACSKKPGEETPPAGQTAVIPEHQAKPVTVQDRRKELLKDLQQIRGELIVMQGTTLKKYPELSQEQNALKNLIEEKLQSLLAAQNVDVEQLQSLQKKLQDANLPQEEKSALMQEFQTKAKLARQARVDAMKDQAVQEAYQQYETHMKEKMIADYPQAAAKLETFDQIQAALQQLENNAGAAPTR